MKYKGAATIFLLLAIMLFTATEASQIELGTNCFLPKFGILNSSIDLVPSNNDLYGSYIVQGEKANIIFKVQLRENKSIDDFDNIELRFNFECDGNAKMLFPFRKHVSQIESISEFRAESSVDIPKNATRCYVDAYFWGRNDTWRDTTLFTWENIPGSDDELLREFLVNDSKLRNRCNEPLDWVNGAKIEKIENDTIINVSFENYHLNLIINKSEQVDNIHNSSTIKIKPDKNCWNDRLRAIRPDRLNYVVRREQFCFVDDLTGINPTHSNPTYPRVWTFQEFVSIRQLEFNNAQLEFNNKQIEFGNRQLDFNDKQIEFGKSQLYLQDRQNQLWKWAIGIPVLIPAVWFMLTSIVEKKKIKEVIKKVWKSL